MIGIKVLITSYVSDLPQPGIVECEFFDAHNRRWRFVEKIAIVSAEYLDARSSYPQTGVIACEIVGRRCDPSGLETIIVDTERPWCVESVEGNMRFEVLAASLVQWEGDSTVQRRWDGRAEPGTTTEEYPD